MRKFIPPIILVMLMGGCAPEMAIRYEGVTPNFSMTSNRRIVVGVHDQRILVARGEMPESLAISGDTFFPFSRNLIPMRKKKYLSTYSKRPFSELVAEAIVLGLNKKGIHAKGIKLSPLLNKREALKKLIRNSGDRNILFTLMEWDGDLHEENYILSLEIFDRKGNLLAFNELMGIYARKSRSFSFANEYTLIEHIKNTSIDSFRNKLEEMINNSKIKKALQ